ncbi:MAG: hypothetical protein U0003_01160 [Vampirovibrionales bacterium]
MAMVAGGAASMSGTLPAWGNTHATLSPWYQQQLAAAKTNEIRRSSIGNGYDPFALYQSHTVSYSPENSLFRRVVEKAAGGRDAFDQTAQKLFGTTASQNAALAKARDLLTHNPWLRAQYNALTNHTQPHTASYLEGLHSSNPHAGINSTFQDLTKNTTWSVNEATAATTGSLKTALTHTVQAAQKASALNYEELFGLHSAEKATLKAVAHEQGSGAALKRLFHADRLRYAKTVLSEGQAHSTFAQRSSTFAKKVLWNEEVRWATKSAREGQWLGAILRPLAVGLSAWDIVGTTCRAFRVSRKQGDNGLTTGLKTLKTLVNKTLKTAFLWSLGTLAYAALGAALSVFALPALGITILGTLGAAAITYGAHLGLNRLLPDPPKLVGES